MLVDAPTGIQEFKRPKHDSSFFEFLPVERDLMNLDGKGWLNDAPPVSIKPCIVFDKIQRTHASSKGSINGIVIEEITLMPVCHSYILLNLV